MHLTNPPPSEIQRLAGCRWRLWKFSPTHDHLAAEILGYPDGKLYISFLICHRIETPTYAELHAPQIIIGDGGSFEFHDSPNEIHISCDEIILHSELPDH